MADETPVTGDPLRVAALPDGVAALVPAYLARQRWYAGSGPDDPAPEATVVDSGLLSAGEGPRLWWAMVDSEGARYQLLVGERHAGEPADFLSAHEAAVLGSVADHYYYDATLDPELAVRLLPLVSGGRQTAERVRPVSAEQSNTSLVYDDRIILKVFRRLLEGANPDVEVTTALEAHGFDHVPAPVAHWRRDGWDLAFAQRFLYGGIEGWALAQTSLRDLYNAPTNDPGEVGGDFSAEASRLGRMTAQMHLAMARAFGVDRRVLAERWWPALLASLEDRLARLSASVGGLGDAAAAFMDRLAGVADPGPAIRVHGDYHLGQVMRTDTGWYVLDFEGEPARPLDERLRPASPLKDVSGMLRSLQYAARFALAERGEEDIAALEPAAERWERHNREAFLAGYRATRGIDGLVPADVATWTTVLDAYELDKALYEVAYEQAYRPAWLSIPLDAVTRLVHAV